MSSRDNKHARPRFFDLTRQKPDLVQEKWDGDPRFAPFPKLALGPPLIDPDRGSDEGDPRLASYTTSCHDFEDLFPQEKWIGSARASLKIVSDDIFRAVQKLRASELVVRRGGHRHE